MRKSKKFVRTIFHIQDDLWIENKNILLDEKPENTIGRPIVPYRKVMDGILVQIHSQEPYLQWCM